MVAFARESRNVNIKRNCKVRFMCRIQTKNCNFSTKIEKVSVVWMLLFRFAHCCLRFASKFFIFRPKYIYIMQKHGVVERHNGINDVMNHSHKSKLQARKNITTQYIFLYIYENRFLCHSPDGNILKLWNFNFAMFLSNDKHFDSRIFGLFMLLYLSFCRDSPSCCGSIWIFSSHTGENFAIFSASRIVVLCAEIIFQGTMCEMSQFSNKPTVCNVKPEFLAGELAKTQTNPIYQSFVEFPSTKWANHMNSNHIK